jgi:hypothetical protein
MKKRQRSQIEKEVRHVTDADRFDQPSLREELNALVARMSTPEAQAADDALFAAPIVATDRSVDSDRTSGRADDA